MDFYSPLRYPGGKGKLSPFIQRLYDSNNLGSGYYVEPFAGGASIALSLLFNEYVTRTIINDIDRSIYAFWYSIINTPDDFCRLISDTPVNVNIWKKQKEIQRCKAKASLLSLGFSTFYLNRTNRSGILNGGIIGGLKQDGEWKIDARYNKTDLIRRVERIANYRNRIDLYNLDACNLVKMVLPKLPQKTLIYFDPPYYVKGKDLYHNYFQHADHEIVSKVVASIEAAHWVVSYDNTSEIRKLYKDFRKLEYTLNYCASSRLKGREVMFFSGKTYVPKLRNPLECN